MGKSTEEMRGEVGMEMAEIEIFISMFLIALLYLLRRQNDFANKRFAADIYGLQCLEPWKTTVTRK